MFGRKKNMGKFERIYQYRDGNFLPDSSQPDPEADYEITSSSYSPHKSTRYMNVKIGSNGKAQYIDAKSGNWSDTNKNLPELYGERNECCGCYACYSICPVKAIFMRPDEEGFLYPSIDSGKCIRCNKCISICDFRQKS